MAPAVCVDDLPDDVLLHVFASLPLRARVRAMRVSRRWRALLRHEMAAGVCWERLSFPRVLSADEALGVLARAPFTHVRSVALRCRVDVHVEGTGSRSVVSVPLWRGLVERLGARLHTLDLSRCTALECVEDEGVAELVRGCAGVEELVLSGCTSLTDAALEAIARHAPRVRVLRVNGCKRLSDFGALALARDAHALEVLDVGKCSEWTDVGVCAVARGACALRTLVLRDVWQVTDASLRALGEHQRTLLELDAGRLIHVTNAGVAALTCPLLERVTLREDTNVNDGGVVALARACPHLTFLDVTRLRITSESVAALAESCPQLRTLVLKRAPLVSDRTMGFVAEMRELRSLTIARTPVYDYGVVDVARACAQLRHLELSRCALRDPTILALAPHARRLRTFGVRLCQRVGDAALVAIAHACPELEVLRAGRTRAGDETLAALAHACARLRVLLVGGCTRVSDHGVLALVHGAARGRIEELELTGTGVGDAGAEAVLTLPALRTLDLSSTKLTAGVWCSAHAAPLAPPLVSVLLGYCRDVGDAALLALLARCTHTLEHLNVDGTAVTDASVRELAHAHNLNRLCLRGTDVSRDTISLVRRTCKQLKGIVRP